MKDYSRHPAVFGQPYALYLIQKPENLTEQMDSIHRLVLPGRLLLSLERLFKGSKKALVIFGPVAVLRSFADPLGLLELEDYSQRLKGKEAITWEMGMKNPSQTLEKLSFISQMLPLPEKEEFWWQAVLYPQPLASWWERMFKKGNRSKSPKFKVKIRAVFQASDKKRADDFRQDFLKAAGSVGLFMLPQGHSTEHMVKFYQDRARTPISSAVPVLNPEEIISWLN